MGRHGWPEEQVEYLRANYQRLHCDVIGMRIGRTVKAVRNKASSLGFSKRAPSVYTARTIANRFGVSMRTVQRSNPSQLSRCPNNAAIRLILGIGEKAQPGESWETPRLNMAGKSYHAGEWEASGLSLADFCGGRRR